MLNNNSWSYAKILARCLALPFMPVVFYTVFFSTWFAVVLYRPTKNVFQLYYQFLVGVVWLVSQVLFVLGGAWVVSVYMPDMFWVCIGVTSMLSLYVFYRSLRLAQSRSIFSLFV